MNSRTVLVTHAQQYAGPGTVAALLAAGNRVLTHDSAFYCETARDAYQLAHPGTTALASQNVPCLAEELKAIGRSPDAAVLNAVHPISPAGISEIALDEMRSTFEDVVIFPVQVAQALLPDFRKKGRGSIVFVTSARERRPEPGFAVPTSMRAATTAFAKAMATELAHIGIQVNVVAPNFLESELYYPAARFEHEPAGRARIAALVPFGRLGKQTEIGELIAFLTSGRSPFLTGEVIGFTGGWAL